MPAQLLSFCVTVTVPVRPKQPSFCILARVTHARNDPTKDKCCLGLNGDTSSCCRAYLGNPLLLIVFVVDGAAVLRACIVALPVLGGRVVDAVKVLHLYKHKFDLKVIHLKRALYVLQLVWSPLMSCLWPLLQDIPENLEGNTHITCHSGS